MKTMKFLWLILILNILFGLVIKIACLPLPITYKKKVLTEPKNIYSPYDVDSTSPLVYNSIYRINSLLSPVRYGTNYLESGKFIDTQDEVNLNFARKIDIKNNCKLDRENILESFNLYRANHDSPNLSYSKILEDKATAFAEKMRFQECQYKSRMVFGELFHYDKNKMTEHQIINNWYKPIFDLDFALGSFKPGTNGYSALQMLWSPTKEVGCAKACCLYSELMICDFYPLIVEPGPSDIILNIKPNKYIPKKKKKK